MSNDTDLQENTEDWANVKWRMLEKGEEIKDGDWVDVAADGWRDDPKWRLTKCAGDVAPDPMYASHRQYRRVL